MRGHRRLLTGSDAGHAHIGAITTRDAVTTAFSLVILYVDLYVDAPERSAHFYADLFGAPVIENSPTFAILPLGAGVMLGLWWRHTVEPGAEAAGGRGEIAFTEEGVDAVHADRASRGVAILQPPADLDFGRAFTAADPDGHRLRVFRPAAG